MTDTPLDKARAAKQLKIAKRRNDVVEFARNCAFDGIRHRDYDCLDCEGSNPPTKETFIRDLKALAKEGRLRVLGGLYFPTDIKDGEYPDWTAAEIEAYQRGEPWARAKFDEQVALDIARIEKRTSSIN